MSLCKKAWHKVLWFAAAIVLHSVKGLRLMISSFAQYRMHGLWRSAALTRWQDGLKPKPNVMLIWLQNAITMPGAHSLPFIQVWVLAQTIFVGNFLVIRLCLASNQVWKSSCQLMLHRFCAPGRQQNQDLLLVLVSAKGLTISMVTMKNCQDYFADTVQITDLYLAPHLPLKMWIPPSSWCLQACLTHES